MGKVCKAIRRIGLLLGLVAALLPLPVFAQENSGSIQIEQLDTDTKEPVAGVKLSLYQIAVSDDSGSYRLTTAFEQIGVNAGDLCSAEKCSDHVELLNRFIEKNNPDAADSKVTGKDGIVDFTELTDGIYFVKQTNTEEDFQKLGYTYKTDELGRIVSVEGRLHMKDREGRLPIKDSIEDIGKGDQKEGDDRGHLVGDQFDGSNGLENMVPQDANINRNDFKNFENELAKEVKDGKDVKVKIEPVYEGDSRRPSAIVVTYSIDGEENVRIFPNSQEE